MEHFAGLDVSVNETSICIVDDAGRIVREAKLASEPDVLLAVLKCPTYHFNRIGLEAGPLSQWLYSLTGHFCRDTAHAGGIEGAEPMRQISERLRHSRRVPLPASGRARRSLS